ncbi:hypothetical protein Sste5346_001936 [Sporothrix stenoceras]|uniref:Sde2 N-terminal ubiquitin domain-containing protein n=1 Tax=Sporothrix stenoceras TaxID=5173 RepID=A0ABR3ZKC4_9PEZI
MDEKIVNVLVAGIPGDGLPSTYSLPLVPSASIDELWNDLYERLPPIQSRLILTTLGNRQLTHDASANIGDLLSSPQDDFVCLRLSLPVLGGKGGFGSQLRAAGGRMSSKRKKNQAEDNGSSRNLDGRRLRTVTEAKNLAEYLAIKPEMDRKEKEKRRQRWEEIVEMAEKKEEDIKSGGKGRLDGKWVEDKEEASERTRAAVLAAMASQKIVDNLQLSTSAGSSTSAASDGVSKDDSEDTDGGSSSSASESPEPKPSTTAASATFVADSKGKGKAKVYFAFDDEDDEFMSSDEEDA